MNDIFTSIKTFANKIKVDQKYIKLRCDENGILYEIWICYNIGTPGQEQFT
jgi:ribonuclease I